MTEQKISLPEKESFPGRQGFMYIPILSNHFYGSTVLLQGAGTRGAERFHMCELRRKKEDQFAV